VCLQTGFHDEIDETGGEQAVAVAVAAIAGHARARGEASEGVGLPALGEEIGMRCRQRRLGEARAGARL